jgi:hypothetical protein
MRQRYSIVAGKPAFLAASLMKVQRALTVQKAVWRTFQVYTGGPSPSLNGTRVCARALKSPIFRRVLHVLLSFRHREQYGHGAGHPCLYVAS